MKHHPVWIPLIALMLLLSCEEVKKDEDSPLEHASEKMIHNIAEGDLEILEIEGCQYIIYKESVGVNHGYGYMAHKGNCTNPIHCYNTIATDSIQ